ncbi:maltoporin [Brenneria roseae subsp. roseae]|uniref:maltoporin n=1 Tax=Brenneria roseae TaxID=1509241 RepID=UPI000D60858B|nr:maltoporin [Brenneria roseae]PWC22860.1 maltoporin [Brenneria roseae subsp. roseae]
MKEKILTTSVALAIALTAANAYAVDFSGYFRSGVGVSNDGKEQTGNQSKLGRLGNEGDTYAEIGLGQQLYNEDGKTFYVDSMISMSSDGSNDNETTKNDDTEFGLRQFNLQATGFITAFPEATIWAGKRYYQRRDIHIIDTKYYNISGAGAGIENIKAGEGAFSFAWIRGDGENMDVDLTGICAGNTDPNCVNDQSERDKYDDLNINFLDARYAGWKPWNGAWTEFGVTYAMPNERDVQKNILRANDAPYDVKNGIMLTAEVGHYFSGLNTNQKLVLQYADKGMAQNMVSQGGGWYDVWNNNTSATGYRVIQTGDLPLGDRVAISHVLTYGKAEKTSRWSDERELFSAVARGQYAWNKNHKTYLEVGTFHESETWTSGDKDKYSGQKYTIAQALTADIPMLTRPELRFYVSYLKDGEGRSFNDGTRNNTMNFGIQAEAWW